LHEFVQSVIFSFLFFFSESRATKTHKNYRFWKNFTSIVISDTKLCFQKTPFVFKHTYFENFEYKILHQLLLVRKNTEISYYE